MSNVNQGSNPAQSNGGGGADGMQGFYAEVRNQPIFRFSMFTFSAFLSRFPPSKTAYGRSTIMLLALGTFTRGP